MSKIVPRVLLIGVGRFGVSHLDVLQKLQSQKLLSISGVVVKTKEKKRELEKELAIPVYTQLTPTLLRNVDGVDIVTPYPTHYSLTKKILPYANVFVEKPIAEKEKEALELARLAKKYKKTLMVGHIYRYHPVTQKLRKLIGHHKGRIRVEGEFISPLDTYRGENPSLEKLHFFDVLDYLLEKKPISIWGHYLDPKRFINISLRYPRKIDVVLKLGWRRNEKIRRLVFSLEGGQVIEADFTNNIINITKNGRRKTVVVDNKPTSLEGELLAWRDVLLGKNKQFPDGLTGSRMVRIANRSTQTIKKPRFAVIGGGLFGAVTAIKLSSLGEVHLFERHKDLMTEASWANQYRHHMGYHYSLSPETIKEIKVATKDFESYYEKSIVRDFPAYYAVAKHDSHVSSREFLSLCKKMGLPYKQIKLPKEVLNPDEVSLTVRTPEAVIDYECLKNDITKDLKGKKVKVCLGHRVTGIRLLESGEKKLDIRLLAGGATSKKFDYVVNATYANCNQFCEWLDFPARDLEWRLKEIAIVRLPIKKPIALMIINGPFSTFVPLGRTGLYTFGGIPLSIHEIRTGKNALKILDKKRKTTKSRWMAMQKRCLKWHPMLKKAEYVGSMFVILTIERGEKANDARPTQVTYHGFGCYSILSGKLITAVTVAKKIAGTIDNSQFV